jgi:hypothetical protein
MENSLNSSWGALLAYVGVPVLVGVVLLIIEYKTGFFAQQVLSSRDKADRQTNRLAGQTVTPVTELENPMGDWIQVAEEVKRLVEQQLETEEHGPVSLRDIKLRRGGKAELVFCFEGIVPYTSNEWGAGFDVRVTVDTDGRVLQYKREYIC